MLIDFATAVNKYGMKIKSAIQVGAHEGQEIEMFKNAGIKKVIFFEPCKKAFDILHEKIRDEREMYAFNVAIGNFSGTVTMNTETVNSGQSNSILKPKKHLEQHPTIVFNGTEEVRIFPLDEYFVEFDNAELLIMDCQGFEKEVLKGAEATLQYVKYIFTEINFEEVYENCARVEEIDEFLSDFKRVETYRVGGWGDALYIRKNLI